MCKKIFFVFLFFAISTSMFSLNAFTTHADSIEVNTYNGASIRTIEPYGLRFKGTVNYNEFSLNGEDKVQYGFILSKGSFDKDEMLALFASSKALDVDAGILDEGAFYVSVINIPSVSFNQNITALAYVKINDDYYFASSSTTRNIEEVANSLIDNDEYNKIDYIKRINGTSTFDFASGDIEFDSEFVINKCDNNYIDYNSVVLSTKANINNCIDDTFIRLFLGFDADKKIYKVVGYSNVSDNNLDIEYDYCIACQSNCVSYYSVFTSIISKLAINPNYYLSFELPNSVNCSVNVCGDYHYDLLQGNRAYFLDEEDLPTLYKEYYIFDGYCLYSDFRDEPVSKHSGELGKKYYAKFTPINYNITYDLQGGVTSAELITKYNIESDITLPPKETMSIDNGEFIGWFDNPLGLGEAITKINVGSYGDLNFYACFELFTINTIVLNSNDISVLSRYNPTKYVNPAFTEGTFSVNNVLSTVGDGVLFNSVSSALAKAQANDIIYVFSGTYSDSLIISKDNITIIGPNADINPNLEIRGSEAIINNTITVNNTGFILNGIDLSTSGKIVTNRASTYLCLKSSFTVENTDNLFTLDDIHNSLRIDKCYFDFSGQAILMRASGNSYPLIDFTFTNNVINGYTKQDENDTNNVVAIYLPYVEGDYLIEGNTFNGFTSYCLSFGGNYNDCDNIIIRNNSFDNSGDVLSIINITNLSSTCILNVSYNTFSHANGKYVINITGSISNTRKTFQYNKFMDPITSSLDAYITYKKGNSANFLVDHNYFCTTPSSSNVNTTGSITNTYSNSSDVPQYVAQ